MEISMDNTKVKIGHESLFLYDFSKFWYFTKLLWVFGFVTDRCIVHSRQVASDSAYRFLFEAMMCCKCLTFTFPIHCNLKFFSLYDSRTHVRATLDIHVVQVVNIVFAYIFDLRYILTLHCFHRAHEHKVLVLLFFWHFFLAGCCNLKDVFFVQIPS